MAERQIQSKLTPTQERAARQFAWILSDYRKNQEEYGQHEEFDRAELDDDRGVLVYINFGRQNAFYGKLHALASRYNDLAFDQNIIPSEVDFTNPMHPLLTRDLTEPAVKVRDRQINEVGKRMAEEIIEQN